MRITSLSRRSVSILQAGLRSAIGLVSTCLIPLGTSAATFSDSFDQDPAGNWRVHGDVSLFSWDAQAKNLAVTWDSSKTNSYFYRPLGTTLGRNQDFSLGFDLRLNDVVASNLFQLSIGFIRLADATRTNFYRGTGMDSPNLVEFLFFPDTGWGPTLSPTIISTNNSFAFSWEPLDLATGNLYRVSMAYTASNSTLTTKVWQNGQPYGPVKDIVLTNAAFDFRVDAVSINSYSEAGQTDYAGTILAHGTIDNLSVTAPEPPSSRLRYYLADQELQLSLDTELDREYTLETTTLFDRWNTVTNFTGTGQPVNIPIPRGPGLKFFRFNSVSP